MKKILSLAAVLAVLTAALSGCSGTFDENTNSDSSEVEAVSVDETSYEESFDGFVKYMSDAGFIKGDGEELTASVIGAAKGKRFTVSAGMGKYCVELFVFEDTKSETASKTISDAQNGVFHLFETTESTTQNTAAAVSEDEKFLMLFTEIAANDNTAQMKEEAVEAVKTFGKE